MKTSNSNPWLFVILLVASACSPVGRETLVAPVHTVTADNRGSTANATVSLPTHEPATITASVSSPVIPPAYTTTPSQTLSPASGLNCTSLSLPQIEHEHVSFPSFQDAVVNSLNNCASPAAVIEKLRYIQSGFVFFVDLNRDKALEIVTGGQLQLLPPTGQQFAEHVVNVFVIYLSGGRYKYKTMFEGTFNGIPELEGFADVNADGTTEVLISIPYGGTWCESFVSVIGWQNDEPVDYFQEVTAFMDCPAITEFVDIDGDGVLEVLQRPRSLIDYASASMKYEFDTRSYAYYLTP